MIEPLSFFRIRYILYKEIVMAIQRRLVMFSFIFLIAMTLTTLSYGSGTGTNVNTITTVDSVGDVGFFTSITIGTDGLPVVSYYDDTNGDLKVLKCGNDACSIGNTITIVDRTGEIGWYTSITIGTDDFPVISYQDNTNFYLKVLKCGNAACSSGNTITSVDTTGNVGRYTSITIGTDGLPVVSYYDFTNNDLKVLKCGNAACSSGNAITSVDTTGYVGRHTSIAIGTDGLPIVSYRTIDSFDLKVLKCGNAACSSGNTITTVDTTGNVGHYTSIRIGTDGLPVVSYYDHTNGDLKVLKCGNAACSSGNTITTVDTEGDVGYFTSITIGTDGLPVVSYYDYVNEDLKVLKCGNAACSSGNIITRVDTTGSVGADTSITIGTDGLPVISYLDITNLDLKVLKCGSQSCLNDCPNLPVRILGTAFEYSNLQDAYDTSLSGDIIQSQATIFTEDFFIDMNKSVLLEGGYDCDYITVIDNTVINGNVTISDGVAAIENFDVQ